MKGLKIALLVLLILLLLVLSAVLYLMLSGQMELLRGILPDALIPRPDLPAPETLAKPAIRAGAPSVLAYIKVDYRPEGDVLTIERKVTKHHQ